MMTLVHQAGPVQAGPGLQLSADRGRLRQPGLHRPGDLPGRSRTARWSPRRSGPRSTSCRLGWTSRCGGWRRPSPAADHGRGVRPVTGPRAEVITAFNADRPRMTLSEVAVAAGISRAAARRFLHTLAELGYVRTDGKSFELTPHVLRLGTAYLSGFGLPQLAQPHLEKLSAEVGESTSAAVLDGTDIAYVARVVHPADHDRRDHRRHPVPGLRDLDGTGPAGPPAAGRAGRVLPGRRPHPADAADRQRRGDAASAARRHRRPGLGRGRPGARGRSVLPGRARPGRRSRVVAASTSRPPARNGRPSSATGCSPPPRRSAPTWPEPPCGSRG